MGKAIIGNLMGSSQEAGSLVPQHVILVDTSGNTVTFGSGGTSSTDGAAFGAGTSVGTPMMGERDDAGTVIADGKLGIPRLTSKRAQHVTLFDSAGVELAVGGGTQYVEDAAAAGNPTGTVPMLVRKDTPADEVTTDGDNIAHRATKYGAAYTQIVTSAGAFVDSFGGGTQYTEDAASAADPVGPTLIAVRRDTLSITEVSADGDNIAIKATNKGQLHVRLADTSVVDGSGVTQPVSNADITASAASLSVLDDWDETDRCKVNTIAGQVGVQGGSGVVTALTQRVVLATDVALPTGANAIGKLAANSGVTIGAVEIAAAQTLTTVTTVGTVTTLTGGGVAHDGVDAGNPIKIGGRADTTFQTAVADADRVDALFDVYGALFTRDDHPNKWSYHENSSSALTDTSVQSAPGAGLSIHVTDIILSCGGATAMSLIIEEGTTTTVIGPLYLEAVAGRTVHIKFRTPKKMTANTAITVTTTGAAAHGLDILGFIAP